MITLVSDFQASVLNVLDCVGTASQLISVYYEIIPISEQWKL